MGLMIRIISIMLLVYTTEIYSSALTSMNVKEIAGKTYIDIGIEGPFSPKIFSLPNPNRVVLDIYQITKFHYVSNIFHSRLLKSIRSGKPYPKIVRLVFETNKAADYHFYKTARGFRLILSNKLMPLPITFPRLSSFQNKKNFYSQEKLSAIRSQEKLAALHHLDKSAPTAIHTIHVPKKTLRDVIIVLDPGHGGKDPGAIGPSRNAEKDVVLAIALKLKRLIDKQPGMKAVLTRSNDTYIELRERLNIARKYNADVFISIHADAFINKKSTGASVFALSQRGATSEAARWLAEKENYSELGGVNLDELDDQNGVIRTVLIDLSQTATISAGLQMGTRVLQNLGGITTLHNAKVEQARFVVLKSPDIPSILIETGFISNPREEKNLTNSAYQNRLTQAIFSGLKNYFGDYPPQGSRLENLATW